MITYELNAASIRRGKEKGWEGEDMLDCLKEIAGDALPENVAGTLRLWADQYGRVSFREVMLMEVRNERVAEELAGHPDLRDWVLERIGPTSFTVKGEELARLQDWLEEQGYAPRREVGSCVERSRDHPDGESFFGRGEHSSEVAADKGGMLQVEDAYPLPEDAFPGVQSLPRMWLAGMRAYHPATLQEMVRRAIRLQLDLRVEAQGRSSRLFTPRRLENIGGVWMVEGIRPTTATVERMKLTEIRRICVEPPFPSPE